MRFIPVVDDEPKAQALYKAGLLWWNSWPGFEHVMPAPPAITSGYMWYDPSLYAALGMISEAPCSTHRGVGYMVED